MVVKKDGSVWTTGRNACGQLGDGSTTDRINYVEVVSSGAKTVAAGSRHSMMLKQDGSVWATGSNLYSQLGDSSVGKIARFIEVLSDRAKSIAAGSFHSMVVAQDGTIRAAGSNEYGQFGDGTTMSGKQFRQITPIGKGTGHAIIIYTCLTSIGVISYHLTTTMHLTVVFANKTKASHIGVAEDEATTDGVN